MICLEFPPVNTTGNYRSKSIYLHLKESGDDVKVFTAYAADSERAFGKSADENLLQGIELDDIQRYPISDRVLWKQSSVGAKVHHLLSYMDDLHTRWFLPNRAKMIAFAKDFEPDLIYVSLPPFSIGKAALELKRVLKKPLITDMRDAWSLWCSDPFTTRIHYLLVKKAEGNLFRHSDYVLGVTPQLIQDFRDQHPQFNHEKFHVVYNGVDLRKKSVTPPESFKTQSISSTTFNIGYVGSFYYSPDAEIAMKKSWWKRKSFKKFHFWPRKEYWVYRSPYFFLLAISHLPEEIKRQIRFHHVGQPQAWLSEMVKQLDLSANFVSHGFQSKSEVLNIQSQWDALLATSEEIEGRPHFCLPSKVFDYVQTGQPIWAFVGEGAQRDFLEKIEGVLFFDPKSPEDNAQIIEKIVQSRQTTMYGRDIPIEYTRKYQTARIRTLGKTLLTGITSI